MKTMKIFTPYGQLPPDVIIKAWQDDSFRTKLLNSPKDALADCGYHPPVDRIKVVINGPAESCFVLPEMPPALKGASAEEMMAFNTPSTKDKGSGTCDY